MLSLLITPILIEIFLFLHPIHLFILRQVCSSFNKLIISPETGKWLFRQRYGKDRKIFRNAKGNPRSIDEVTYWDLYFPLPGGERYIDLELCRRDAYQNKDRISVKYFTDLMKKYNKDELVFDNIIFYAIQAPLTRDEIDFVIEHVIYDDSAFYFSHNFGFLLGLYGDVDLYYKELQKFCSSEQRLFIPGFISALLQEGHLKFNEIIKGNEQLLQLSSVTEIIIQREHDGLKIFEQCNSKYTIARAYIKIRDYDSIMQILALKKEDYSPISIIGNQYNKHKEKGLTFDQYLIKLHPEYIPHLKTPRGYLERKKRGEDINKLIIHNFHTVYQKIIYAGDWEIYDEFVNIFYPDIIYNTKDGKHCRLRRPHQRLIYKPIHRLIKEGNIRRLAEIIVRLPQLYVMDLPRFWQVFIYSAFQVGRKDLVLFALPYVPTGTKLPLTKQRLDMQAFVGSINLR